MAGVAPLASMEDLTHSQFNTPQATPAPSPRSVCCQTAHHIIGQMSHISSFVEAQINLKHVTAQDRDGATDLLLA